MAVALGFGLIFATFTNLILIPCLYLMLDDLNIYLIKEWSTWRGKSEVSTELPKVPKPTITG